MVQKVFLRSLHLFSGFCNKIFAGAGGQILSPDYPEEYPDNLGCTWVIKTDVNFRIKITFEEFQLEGAAKCLDKLIVNDGIQKNSPRLGRVFYLLFDQSKHVIALKTQ